MMWILLSLFHNNSCWSSLGTKSWSGTRHFWLRRHHYHYLCWEYFVIFWVQKDIPHCESSVHCVQSWGYLLCGRQKGRADKVLYSSKVLANRRSTVKYQLRRHWLRGVTGKMVGVKPVGYVPDTQGAFSDRSHVMTQCSDRGHTWQTSYRQIPSSLFVVVEEL